MIEVNNRKFSLFLTQDQIDKRVQEISVKLNSDYAELNPVFLVILNGAFRFAGDISTYIDIPCEWQFVKLSSYQGMQSTGKIKVSDTLGIDLTDRHIIIVEDIVDTGNSMSHFMERLEKVNPRSIKLVSLFVKEEVLQGRIKVDIAGFSIPDKFIVGYGLDFDEQGRHLNGIWQVVDG